MRMPYQGDPDELFRQAFGDTSTTEQDAALAIEYGIGNLERYVNSGQHFDDGIDWVTEYDAGELEQANWFLQIAWESLAEELWGEGYEDRIPNAWVLQHRGPSRSG